MKKIISLLLTLIMLFTLAVPAVYAADGETANKTEATPIIQLRGNGEGIYYENGTGEEAPIDLDEVLSDPSIYDMEGMKKEIVNILIPFLIKGLPADDWDECRKAIYNAISPFFKQAILDGNGVSQMETTISKNAQDSNANPEISYKDEYSVSDLIYHYDWRLVPTDNVDGLHEYILKVLGKTGETQVSLVSRCLGGTLINAYLQKYGHLGLVKNVVYGDTLGNGSTILSKILSGKLSIDGKNTQRYMGQLERCAETGQGIGFALPTFVDEVLTTTLDLFTQTNVTDVMGDGIEKLYDELLQVLLPALLHAVGYATNGNYWACVRDEDFDTALTFIFGEEGSEAREYYEGFITKITEYHTNITEELNNILTTCINKKMNIANVSKYGYLNMPMIEDNDILSDSLTSLEHATFGATCAKVGETLSDNDIAGVDSKYISPDKQVNVSTSLLKDTTWVIKNCHHGYADLVFAIADEFCNNNLTNVDDSTYPRFIMYDELNGTWSEMTEDNCADLEFMTRAEKEPTVMTKLIAGFRFLTMILKLLTRVISGEISFDAFGKLLGK